VHRLTLAAVTALVATTATAYAAFAGTQTPLTADPVWTAITQARTATAKFQDVHAAVKAGYMRVSACVQAPPPKTGAMGIHYLNPAYADDPAIVASKPELLLYFPAGAGKLRLVAVEYWRPDSDQKLKTDDDRPSLAGLPFQGPMEGHDPKMPRHYDLHAWVWAYNPAGTFAQYNPGLHC
jgi:hypothetical protein